MCISVHERVSFLLGARRWRAVHAVNAKIEIKFSEVNSLHPHIYIAKAI